MTPRSILPLVSVLAALLVSGCGRPREPEPFRGGGSSGAPVSQTPSKPAPTPAPAPAPAAEAKPEGGASLQQYARNLAAAPTVAAKTIDTAMLNRAVQQFGSMEGRLPASLDELVTAKYLAELPKAPAGYRLDYDTKTGAVAVVKIAP